MKSALVKSVKSLQRSDPEAWFRYTTECGENIRDPNRHSEKFLEDFLRLHSEGSFPKNVNARATDTTEKVSAPPGKLSSPPGQLCARSTKLEQTQLAAVDCDDGTSSKVLAMPFDH
jgi:hypothetical protein